MHTQIMLHPTQIDEYWQAVVGHDARYDGVFVIGVKTTGIYCRPTCTVRRPKRENVIFFAGNHAAENAGFRACKRCRPTEAYPNDQVPTVQRICAYLDEHSEESITLTQLGTVFHLSPFHLQRMFKQVTGLTPRQYIDGRRMQQVRSSLREGQAVTEALYQAGYGSSSRLYERSNRLLGMTPSSYRKGGAGMTIAYSIVQSPLNWLLVAATDRGLCAVHLGNDPDLLLEEVKAAFPLADFDGEVESLNVWVDTVLDYLRGWQPQLDLPLDIQATSFQLRVWEALREIPYGETRSYTQIATAIGQPTAARAVARACATNPTALVIPCHRVVRENGDLSGYRWGIERKAALLEMESEHGER